MPSMAEELAALTRSSRARRPGSRSQGLLPSKDVFMLPFSPSAAVTGKEQN